MPQYRHHVRTTRDSSYFERLGMEIELERLQKQAAEIRDRLQRLPARIRERLQIPGLATLGRAAQLEAPASSWPDVQKRTFSAKTRQRMAKAQRARWAKQRGGQTAAGRTSSGRSTDAATPARQTARKRTMSAEARRRISEAQKARWAKRRRTAAPKKR